MEPSQSDVVVLSGLKSYLKAHSRYVLRLSCPLPENSESYTRDQGLLALELASGIDRTCEVYFLETSI